MYFEYVSQYKERRVRGTGHAKEIAVLLNIILRLRLFKEGI